MLVINDSLTIPAEELDVSAVRGGGPGGQHVNKVASKVVIRFDVANSPSLTESQRQRLLDKLQSRLTKDGVLVLSSHESRSQAANRELLTQRFSEILAQALERPRPRRRTRPTRASKQRRIEHKKRRARIKRGRSRVRRDDG
jgi:ribosome-associated protein